jgi:hypothetical protein
LGTTASWARAKITLAIHPGFGEEVVVRRCHGAGRVLVETKAGQHFLLPIEWTDLKPPALVAAVHVGRTVHLAPGALEQLASWVEARAQMGCKEVGHFDKRGENSDPDGKHRLSDALTAGELRPGSTAGGRQQRHRPTAAVVEQARSPDAAGRRDDGEGRKRGQP